MSADAPLNVALLDNATPGESAGGAGVYPLPARLHQNEKRSAAAAPCGKGVSEREGLLVTAGD
jgi:hypothetical protein